MASAKENTKGGIRICTDDMLQDWIREDEHKKLIASWNNKHIVHLYSKWLDHPRYSTDLVLINLSQNGLQVIPEMLIWGLPALRSLNLSDNKLTTLPLPCSPERIHFSKLDILDLSNNKLEAFPPAICQLTSLSDLTLKNNRISYLLAAQDWSLHHLRNLDLSHNLLKHESLQCYARHSSSTTGWFMRKEDDEVTVSLTEIEFPQCVCSTLISLNLSNNPIMDIPWSIFEMKQLQVLKLDGLKNVERLPHELGKLNHLHLLTLDGTSISYPAEVKKLKDGVQSTLKIKKILWNKFYDCRSSRAMKLIIIGPEKSGKTHLVTRLTDSPWPMVDRGVNVQNWSLAFTKKQQVGFPREIHFSVRDLKGGPSYATVNQCMLTSRAMYILVWDLRNGKEEIEKLQQWILNIKSQCRGFQSRIIIAGTHLDNVRVRNKINQQKSTTDIGSYSHQLIGDIFPELRETMIDVDGLEAGFESIVNLRRLLFCTASNVKYRPRFNAPEEPFIGRQVPRAHMILMEHINDKAKTHSKNSTPPIMTEAELISIIGTIPSHRIETPREIDEAVQYLQDRGRVLCITDHTYRLTRLYFLDSSWLCDALMDAMNIKNSSFEQELPEGIVSTERLKAIGKQHGFSDDTVEDYLQLLARFEIAFPHSEGRHMIVSKLPSALVMDPATVVSRNDTLYRWYKMPNVPAGFWSRLVSRIRKDIKRINDESKDQEHAPSFHSHGPLRLKEAYIAVAQRDIFIRHSEGEIRVEPMRFPDGYSGIRLTVRCRHKKFRPMGYLVSHIENLIDEWYPALRYGDSIRCLIPCTVCMTITPHSVTNTDNNETTQYHVFPLGTLAVLATIRKASTVICHRHKDIPVPLKEIVPDLFLVDLDIHHLDESKLECSFKLGQGGFGEVLSARYLGEQVALKRLLTKVPERSAEITEEEVFAVLDSIPKLRVEVAMMCRLRHPYILKLIGVSIHNLNFIMEFAPQGDLHTEVSRQYQSQKSGRFSLPIVHGTLLPKVITYKIVLQIIMALEYMHGKKVIHTDIKTDNVLLFSLDPRDRINVKLADYGIAHSLDDVGVRGLGGLHVFCAPEIIAGRAFKEKVDMFSLGMLIYHVMSGVVAFEDINDCVQVRQIISAGTRPQFSHRNYKMIPHFACMTDAMESCWQNTPHSRPPASQLHEAMTNPGFSCLDQVMTVSGERDTTVYVNSSLALQTDGNHYIFQWRGDGERRYFTKYETDIMTETTETFPGDRVTCAIARGNTHILGIKDQLGRKAIDIYVYNEGHGQRWRLSHYVRRKVGHTVSSICCCLDDNNQIEYLLVGQENGSVSIFSPTSLAISATKIVSFHKHPKNLTLSITPQNESFNRQQPCDCRLR